MRPELVSKIAKYYGEKICNFGSNAKGVDWKDEYSQNLRFKQLLKIIYNNMSITLNDLGCGYGALYLYLNQETPLKVSKYYGYEISEDILVNAKKLINDKNVSFIKSDKILIDADYSLASGVFNVKLNTNLKLWKEFILDTLFNMN